MTAGTDQLFLNVANVLGGTIEAIGQYVTRLGGRYDEDDSYSPLVDSSVGFTRINQRRGFLVDLQTKVAGEDLRDDAQCNIDFAHREIHEGDYFSATSYGASGISTASPGHWTISAPNTIKRIHFGFELTAAGSGGRVELIADPVITTVGTVIPAWNNNRNSYKVATAECRYGVVATLATGKCLKNWVIGSTGGGSRNGGGASVRIEHVLMQAKTYLVKFTPAANDTPTAINLEWYELEVEG